ncbi:Crinkler (CRN) [Phytophthora megakarya]|uniref:Crinkler (CRN) n=1 Tax=Phytophthora megakarya TaxID=4795 RepID=A0A225WCN3_9STRA|nr:Crinkler (CRN) [Phytophthora megakarya]
MKRAHVCNVDDLVELNLEEGRVMLPPRGITVKPENLLELLGALRDVLQALVGLHHLGWVHRDIRWSNVIRQRNGISWFLIDITKAATSPQPWSCGRHLSAEEYAPEILRGCWLLIETSRVSGWVDFGDRASLKDRMMAKYPKARPSAEEALAVVVKLEEAEKMKQEGDLELERDQSQLRDTSYFEVSENNLYRT